MAKKPAPKYISKVPAPSAQTQQSPNVSAPPISAGSKVNDRSTNDDSHTSASAATTSINSTTSADSDLPKNLGNVPIVQESAGLPGIDEDVTIQTSRAKQPGETRAQWWERLRKAARNAGLPRGQGPGTAYEWANLEVERQIALAQSQPEPETIVSEPDLETDETEICRQLATTPSDETQEKLGSAQQPENQNGGVSGLGEIPESWPELPANAPLQVEIAWVSANRLRVRSGSGVDLSKALSPAPSYSALSWLETSILFPAKFADISVKASAEQDSEKEFIKRERLAIEEIRSILAEMLEAGGDDDD